MEVDRSEMDLFATVIILELVLEFIVINVGGGYMLC